MVVAAPATSASSRTYSLQRPKPPFRVVQLLWKRYHQCAMGRTVSNQPLRCTACGANDVIQIELTLPDGTEVEFYSCHKCDTRWWNREGEPLPLDAVLDLARKSRTP